MSGFPPNNASNMSAKPRHHQAPSVGLPTQTPSFVVPSADVSTSNLARTRVETLVIAVPAISADAIARSEEPGSSSSADGPPASSADDDMPTSAQAQRPMTPPRPALSAHARPAASPSSSQHIVTPRAPTLSQPASTLHLTQTEVADDSPDPLRISPTPLSASSAGRSARLRSLSAEPSPRANNDEEHESLLQRSPIHTADITALPDAEKSSASRAPGRVSSSSTSSQSGVRVGRHAPPVAFGIAARALGSQSATLSDDELGLGICSPGVTPPAPRSSVHQAAQFDCVEICVGSSQGLRASCAIDSLRSTDGTSEGHPELAKLAMTATLTRRKADGEHEKHTRQEQQFEVVLPAVIYTRSSLVGYQGPELILCPEQPRSRPSSRSPLGSHRSSPIPVAGASTSTSTLTSVTSGLRASPDTCAHPNPLALSQSQLVCGASPSSPLTSLPPSQPERKSLSPVRGMKSSTRTKRPRLSTSSAAARAGHDDCDAGHGSSSATEVAAALAPVSRKKTRTATSKRSFRATKKQVAAAKSEPEARARAAAAGSVRGSEKSKGKSKANERRDEKRMGFESESGSSTEEEPPKLRTQQRTRNKAVSTVKSRAGGKTTGETPESCETIWDEEEALKHFAAQANRGTRRRRSMRQTLKEESTASSASSSSGEEKHDGLTTDDDDAHDGDNAQAVAKLRGSPRKRARPTSRAKKPEALGTPKRARPMMNASPTKIADGELAPPSSSPSKGSWLPALGSFGSQLLGNDCATVESSEQRSQGWTLAALPRDRPIWIHVRKYGKKNGFWWPGQLDCGHWESPVRIKLYLDPDSTVLKFSPEIITFDSPNHDDLATFRNPTKLRFDKHIFRDAKDEPTPSDEAFEHVLENAMAKDSGLEDDDEEEALLPPGSLGTTSGQSGIQTRRPEVDDENETSEEDLQATDEQEDDQWLEGGGEAAGMTFPFYCLARDKRTWWAARAARYEPPSSPTKGPKRARSAGKFVVEWTDGSSGRVTRANLLTPFDAAFFTVKMGETKLDLPDSYITKLRDFCSASLPSRFQKAIKEQLPFAQEYNDAFFAGGSKRELLAQKSAFGEMSPEAIDVIQEAIDKWANGGAGMDGPLPKGSMRYEALGPNERNQYRVDVLLSIAVTLNYIDDEGLVERAEADLRARGVVEPSEDLVEEEAFKLARSELELRSATKTVLAMRQSRHIASASRKQKAAVHRDKCM